MDESEMFEDQVLQILGGAPIKPLEPVRCEYSGNTKGYCYASPQEKRELCIGKRGARVDQCQYYGTKWMEK